MEVFGDLIPGISSSSEQGTRRLRAIPFGQSTGYSQETCWDSPKWEDGMTGKKCSDYKTSYCDTTTNSYKPHRHPHAFQSKDANFPDLHCCGCGRCSDTKHWTDPCSQPSKPVPSVLLHVIHCVIAGRIGT